MKNTRKSPPQGAKQFRKHTTLLKAGESGTVGLGTYPVAKQESDFTIKADPDIGEMLGTSLEIVNIPGSDRFMGLYQLHNYGDKDCKVTISIRTIGDTHNGRS